MNDTTNKIFVGQMITFFLARGEVHSKPLRTRCPRGSGNMFTCGLGITNLQAGSNNKLIWDVAKGHLHTERQTKMLG